MKVLFFVLLVAMPAYGGGDIITDHLTLTYSSDSSRAVGYITTDYSITSVVVVTTYHQHHWSLQWIVSGQCESAACGETKSSQYYAVDDFSVVQTYGTFQYPYTTNQAYWSADFSQTNITNSRCWFTTEKVEDSDVYEYSASVLVEGDVPEPHCAVVLGLVLLQRRVRKTPVRVFLFCEQYRP